MQEQIIECVPNFSEGRDSEVIQQIASAILSVEGVRLLNIDPGEATNRTVMTFIGEAKAVVEAAFKSVALAAQLIDMRQQKGTHPRLGATDVLPLIPISGITLKECATLARDLAKKISEELKIPTYCYEAAAFTLPRRNLAVCRKGEYEALPERLTSTDDAPDFGARPFDEIIARSGATNVGARNFLIAVNFNIDTKSIDLANAIAEEVRESGKPSKGIRGTLKYCKAIGWYIEEYGVAQVSMNLTNISVTPLHVAFDKVKEIATKHGAKVTGTEIIGLIPKQALLDAGAHYSTNPQAEEKELINTAIRTMGLDDLCEFDPSKKILSID